MKRIIWLRDLAHLPITQWRDHGLTAEQLATARAQLARDGLRFNNANGVTRDDDDPEIERFVRHMTGTAEQMENPTQWTPYDTEDDVMAWEFSRLIICEADRTRRNARAA